MNKNIILGTVQFGTRYGLNNSTGKPEKESVFKIFDFAWANNIQTLDTADAYGDSISIIAEYHRQQSNRFKINTKFKNAESDTLESKIRNEIYFLGINSFETVFFHSVDTYKSDIRLKEKLSHLKNINLIKKIGVSLYTNNDLLEVIQDPLIDVIQVPFNLLDNHSQRGALLSSAVENGKIIQVRSIFLQGVFFASEENLVKKVKKLQPWVNKINQILTTTSHSINKEVACLLYPYNKHYIDEIIIGVDSIEQLQLNINSLNDALPKEIEKELDSIKVTNQDILFPYNW